MVVYLSHQLFVWIPANFDPVARRASFIMIITALALFRLLDHRKPGNEFQFQILAERLIEFKNIPLNSSEMS